MKVKIGHIYSWDEKHWMITGETHIEMIQIDVPAWTLYNMAEPDYIRRVSKVLFDSTAKKVS